MEPPTDQVPVHFTPFARPRSRVRLRGLPEQPGLAPHSGPPEQAGRTDTRTHLSPLCPLPRRFPLTEAPRTSASVAMTQS